MAGRSASPGLLDAVIAIVRRELETSRAPRCYPDLTGETTFEGDLLCSTIDLVCITDTIEHVFACELPSEPLETCQTIGALADLIAATVAREAA